MKFILFKNECEVKKYYEGCTTDRGDTNPEPLKTFENKNEALKKLQNYKTSVTDFRNYYLVEEYYVEEEIQDEDGEFVDGGDILDYSKLEGSEYVDEEYVDENKVFGKDN